MYIAELSISGKISTDDIVRCGKPRDIDWLVLLLYSSYDIAKFCQNTWNVELKYVTYVPQPCGHGIAKHPCLAIFRK